MIQQTIDLAIGRAFTPDSIDSTVSLARRFAKRPFVAVTLFKDGLELVPVTYSGTTPVFGDSVFNPTGGEDVDATSVRAFAEKHKIRDCLLNLATGYTAVLSTRARRPENDEEAILVMRDNPERLLGEPPAQGCRNSLAYHPTHNFAVVFAHKETEINAAVNLAAKAELGVARMQCGMSSLLNYIIGNCWTEVGQEAEILFVDRGSLFYMPVSDGAFGRPLFDVGLKETALTQAIAERIGKFKDGGKVILVDSSNLKVEEMIRQRGSNLVIVTPLKSQTLPALWACCSDQPKLGYDLYPNERTVRPFAPRSMRVLPFVFWAALAASIAVAGINTFRKAQAEQLARGYKAQAGVLNENKKQSQAVIADVQARGRTAAAMCDWLLISPSTEGVLIALTKEVEGATTEALNDNKSVGRVDSLSLTRQEGQPQMRLVVVITGDGPAANRIFQRFSALFGRLGYSTVDLKVTLVPSGFRYEHLVNLPKA